MEGKCRICNSRDLSKVILREKMLNTNDEFCYLKCASCGCYQIAEIPKEEELSKYYPKNYYSFVRGRESLRSYIKKVINITAKIFGSYRLLSKTFYRKNTSFRAFANITPPPSKWDGVLDIGCGNGFFLILLRELGFKNLYGTDLFLEDEYLVDEKGLRISNENFENIKEKKFDLITLNHSFEHMADPGSAMKALSALLNKGGTIIIRIPIVPNYALNRYKENWVQFDVPRHLFIYSLKAVNILAQNAGLKISKVRYDSNEFQFYGSEMYKRGLSLQDDFNKHISKEDMSYFKRKSGELNKAKMGDQTVIYLKHGVE